MQVPGLLAKKVDQTQGFLKNGMRIPMTLVHVIPNVVIQIKTKDKEGYNALQLGTGTKKRSPKAITGHIKKAGLTQTPRFFREIRVDEFGDVSLGMSIRAQDIFKPGDTIDVTGISKGKGYAGVVKRHGFAGGPRTHGQSDRERAPGSIGQTTTPGRVYKGKRMAGRMGGDTVTIKNLEVIDIEGDIMCIKGLIPGPRGIMVTIIKIGENKKFSPIFKTAKEESVAEIVEATDAVVSADETVEPAKVQAGAQVETVEETVSETVKVPLEEEGVSEKKEK